MHLYEKWKLQKSVCIVPYKYPAQEKLMLFNDLQQRSFSII